MYSEFEDTIREALATATVKPQVIVHEDPEFPPPGNPGTSIGTMDYASFLASGDEDFAWRPPNDEWDAISLNYTSGTTGNPKGVVYHHRGAHLMGYANLVAANVPKHPVYLWTLPMFHCNGWCFPWSISAVAGTHVCLRAVRPKAMYDAMADHGVTHLCGAPIVMSTLLNTTEEERRPLDRRIVFITAAAPAARGGACEHGRGRLRRHPRIRADRDVRARRRQ